MLLGLGSRLPGFSETPTKIFYNIFISKFFRKLPSGIFEKKSSFFANLFIHLLLKPKIAVLNVDFSYKKVVFYKNFKVPL